MIGQSNYFGFGFTTLKRKPLYIAKFHQEYNLIGKKNFIEKNRGSSLEIKCRIARIEVDYSLSNLIS